MTERKAMQAGRVLRDGAARAATRRGDAARRPTSQTATVPMSVMRVLGMPGTPLDPSTRQAMETRFGHDFAGVRIHADADAARSAQVVAAAAYSVGRHVAFARGRYAPQTAAGQTLLAHELAHVTQSAAADPMPTRIGEPDEMAEADAERRARAALQGAAVQPGRYREAEGRAVVRRQEEDLGRKPDLVWIAEEVYLAMKGLGTDEERVYRALERLKRHQPWIDELRRIYRRHGDLDADLDDDFSGTELEYALQLINAGHPKSAQAPLAQRYGWGDLGRVARKVYDELSHATTDEEAVYALLLPLDHDPMLTFGLEMAFHELTRRTKSLRERLVEEMSGEELAHAQYLISIPYEWWVRRANEKLRETAFGIPWGSFCGPEPKNDSEWPDAYDQRYWTQQSDPEFGCKLVLRENVLPSVAVEAIVEEQDKWNIDCGVFVQLTHWYAMLHVDGPLRFNQRMGRPVELRQEKSTGTEVESTFCRRDFDRPLLACKPSGKDHVPIPKAVPVDEAEILRNAPIGTRVVFSNPLVEEAKGHLQKLPTDVEAYLNENSVKLGDDQFGAFPLGSRGGYVLSREEVVDRMAARTYSALKKGKDEVKRQIFISLIQITRPKGG